jgi:hypothetical protein
VEVVDQSFLPHLPIFSFPPLPISFSLILQEMVEVAVAIGVIIIGKLLTIAIINLTILPVLEV